MIVLVLIGFLGGLVTGISPCILPVLPVIFATGAASGIEEDAAGGNDEVAADGIGEDVVEDEVAPALAATSGATVVARRRGTDPPGSTSADKQSLLAARRRRRRPLAVVGGLVLSFSLLTLTGSWLLSALGLPQDALRWIGLLILGVVGLGLIVPGG